MPNLLKYWNILSLALLLAMGGWSYLAVKAANVREGLANLKAQSCYAQIQNQNEAIIEMNALVERDEAINILKHKKALEHQRKAESKAQRVMDKKLDNDCLKAIEEGINLAVQDD